MVRSSVDLQVKSLTVQRQPILRLSASWGWFSMTDPYVLYYPPTNSYSFLLVSFSANGAIEVKPFATEEEAETFLAEKTGLRSPLE